MCYEFNHKWYAMSVSGLAAVAASPSPQSPFLQSPSPQSPSPYNEAGALAVGLAYFEGAARHFWWWFPALLALCALCLASLVGYCVYRRRKAQVMSQMMEVWCDDPTSFSHLPRILGPRVPVVQRAVYQARVQEPQIRFLGRVVHRVHHCESVTNAWDPQVRAATNLCVEGVYTEAQYHYPEDSVVIRQHPGSPSPSSPHAALCFTPSQSPSSPMLKPHDMNLAVRASVEFIAWAPPRIYTCTQGA